ncbi:thiamine pyrophosphate-dependent dehydrogenase E1 component subunit alpha [Hornefia butyriciproducens]|uniref:Thiamine pyrophosphate-dependent dehydrogenase E1 component subunit alpha n=1 Tax=Hornefia butyriciproducens TaxID=2652293 RepID=A0A6L5Y618_9FIRM|nr:thiamine pyrophosphate-dependent dehydrogenase E1 component subunit alpha [Hornefia butyriciproducens]MST51307.1 thiamine pyrophosphate-dependent dehydrogenase E1 component subunit alpha [Hornefia butyriciproducens]
MKYPKEYYMDTYEKLTFARQYEMKVPELLATGKLPGFYHLAVGQEAIQMAIYLEKEDADWLSPHPRCHPLYALTCGINDFTTEMIGRKSSLCGGVASYVHIFSPEHHICPSNGLMGENQAIGAGFGLALTEFDDTEGCLILGIGDGTLEEGAVNEVMNVIASRNLKVCMIIENNDITISTRKHDVSRLRDPGERAYGMGLPVMFGDGNDIFEARELIRIGLEKARRGEPNVISLKTYRLRGHFEGDPTVYRDPAETEEAMKHEPVKRCREFLMSKGIATEEELNAIDEAQGKIVNAAFEQAVQAEIPTPEDVIGPELVFAD